MTSIVDAVRRRLEDRGVDAVVDRFDDDPPVRSNALVVICVPMESERARSAGQRWWAEHADDFSNRAPRLITTSLEPWSTRATSRQSGIAEHLALDRAGARGRRAGASITKFADDLAEAALAALSATSDAHPRRSRRSGRRAGRRRSRRRITAFGIVGAIAALTVATTILMVTGLIKLPTADAGLSHSGPLTQLRGVVGSEKMPFFNDPAVRDRLAEHGLDVSVESAGSFRMAELPDIASYDFAFPASEIAAQRIQERVGIGELQSPFSSPMAIATFAPIVELLRDSGAASQDADGRWIIDLAAVLDLVRSDTRWKDLPGATALYNSPRSVLITSTDVRSSNSAVMYLALAAYVESGARVPTSTSEADAMLPLLERLFLAQGYAGASSSAPFEEYLELGIGAAPMVMVYEGQYLGEQLSPTSRIGDDMVLAYPSPTIVSQHTAVTFTDAGARLLEALATDPQLAELIAAHGFRPSGEHSAAFRSYLDAHGVGGEYPEMSAFHDVAREPSFEMLDYLITAIARSYELTGAPAPPTEDAPATMSP